MPISPVAILCSDLHLSIQQPVFRADASWLDAQAHYLKQVAKMAGDLPVVIAGDIFDRWNPPPELITFAMRNLPKRVIAIPGQHDLPNHVMEHKHRSGYGVLVESGRIQDISEGGVIMLSSEILLHGFGWGEAIERPLASDAKLINVAAVHHYVWCGSHRYPDASEQDEVCNMRSQLKGYDAAVFGDNHKGFLCSVGSLQILNCGGFMRRKSDEVDYSPCVGVLLSDGSIKRVPLNTDIDKFHTQGPAKKESNLDISKFVEQLESLGEEGMHFREIVEQHLRSSDASKSVKQLVIQSLESNA